MILVRTINISISNYIHLSTNTSSNCNSYYDDYPQFSQFVPHSFVPHMQFPAKVIGQPFVAVVQTQIGRAHVAYPQLLLLGSVDNRTPYRCAVLAAVVVVVTSVTATAIVVGI